MNLNQRYIFEDYDIRTCAKIRVRGLEHYSYVRWEDYNMEENNELGMKNLED